MKNFILSVISIILLGLIGFTSWSILRSINYNLSYKDKIEVQIDKKIKPLQNKIEKLQTRISILENKGK